MILLNLTSKCVYGMSLFGLVFSNCIVVPKREFTCKSYFSPILDIFSSACVLLNDIQIRVDPFPPILVYVPA